MSGGALVFVGEKYNKNSIAALCGAIEQDKRLSELPIYVPRRRERLEQVKELLRHQQLVIVAFSFCTPNLIEVARQLEELHSLPDAAGNGRLECIAGGPHPSGDYRGTLPARL
jgi:hypothetical protein